MKIKNNFFKNPQFKNFKDKKKIFFKNIIKINNFHFRNCKKLKSMKNKLDYFNKKIKKISDIPFLPVTIFKEFDMISINKKKIFKVLNSSGTSSKNPSKIYLDKSNSYNQQLALKLIIENLIGNKRLPMLIIDKKSDKFSRNIMNAKKAAIYGFSIFGTDYTYAIDDKNRINYKVINNFLNKHKNQKIFIFGFTFDIYRHLIKNFEIKKLNLDFSNSILLHGGGWKKIEQNKINRFDFNRRLINKFNIKTIRNYYGMIEQTGSIYLECACGYLTCSNLSEIIIRDEKLNPCKFGKKGLIQTLSLLPSSYPGHSILTEDIGEIVNSKKCKCNMKGTKFLVHGRNEKSEIRGCSDI